MSDTVRILWTGLTGRTGLAAMKSLRGRDDVVIVGGLTRRDISGIRNPAIRKGLTYGNRGDIININGERFKGVKWANYSEPTTTMPRNLASFTKSLGVDVIVDFSHPNVFDEVLEVAIRTEKPLIIGTLGLDNRQIAMLYDAAKIIPVFRGGNFRFKVKKFIDEAVEYAKTHDGELSLFERLYQDKSIPSEISKVIRERIFEETGKSIRIFSETSSPKDHFICNWAVYADDTPEIVLCKTLGFNELAYDVLEIAKVMAKKPVRESGDFYDLDEIWLDLTLS